VRGHVEKKSGRYYVVMELDRDPESGERQRKGLGGYATKREAERVLRDALGKADLGRDPFPEDVHFKPYSRDVLSSRRASGRLRPTTAHRYEGLLRDDIWPVVGALELRKIRPAHVRAVLDKMQQRGVSARTAMQARAVFGAIMKQALADGLLDSNPVSAVPRPKPGAVQKKVPSAEQISAFLAATKGSPWEIPMLLASTTGARRSEVLALAWEDVDLKSGRMTIRRGLHWLPSQEGPRTLSFLDPKSETAHRTLKPPAAVIERLRLHRQEQLERRLALGAEWSDLDLVSEHGDGSPLDPDLMTKAFKRFAAAAGLHAKTTLHDLRHAFCTELGRRGIHPRIVQQLAGHSDPAFTMRVYQHAWDEGADQAADAMTAALDL
jgi:integrase